MRLNLGGHAQREASPRDHIAHDFPLRETSRTKESKEGRKRLRWGATWRWGHPDVMRGFSWRRRRSPKLDRGDGRPCL